MGDGLLRGLYASPAILCLLSGCAGVSSPGSNALPATFAFGGKTKAAQTSGAQLMKRVSATKAVGTLAAGTSSAIAVAISASPTTQRFSGGLATAAIAAGTGRGAAEIRAIASLEQQAGAKKPPLEVRPVMSPQEWRALRTRLRLAPPGLPALHEAEPALATRIGATAGIWVYKFAIGSNQGTYIRVPATLRFNSAHGHIWIDDTLVKGAHASASFAHGSIASTVRTIGTDFENAYVSDTAHFASPNYPDDAPGRQVQFGACDAKGVPTGSAVSQYISEPGDRKIDLLILNTAALGSGVGGDFFGLNFIPQAAWNCAGANGGFIPKSNQAPILFLGWFDYVGKPDMLGGELVRGTAHELQHLINFVNHEILPPAAATYPCQTCDEDSYINEGLSVLSQDLAIHRMYPVLNFDANNFAAGYGGAAQYLAAPQNVDVRDFYGTDPGSSSAYSGCSGCYGSGYLLERYMHDRFGGDRFTHGMETSGLVGFANLQKNGGDEPAEQLLTDFAIAMAASSAGITASLPVHSPYRFGTLNLLGTYSEIFGAANTLHGVGFASVKPVGTSSHVAAPVALGGFGFFQLTPIAKAGENVTVRDTTADSFGLTAGLVTR